MLVIKKVLFYIILILPCFLITALGYYGFTILNSINTANDLRLKFIAENFLFYSAIFISILVFMAVIAAKKSHKLFRDLDKIAELTHHGQNHTSEYLKRIGKLGQKIDALFIQLNKLNEMKSLKISALTNLNEFLCDNFDMKLFILDRLCRIINISKTLLQKLNMEEDSMINESIAEHAKGLDCDEIVAELETLRKPITRKDIEMNENDKYKGDFIFYPIFNSRNELSNIVCILEDDKIIDELSKKAEQVKVDENTRHGLFRGLSSRVTHLLSKRNDNN